MALLSGSVVEVCVQLTLPLPLFQLMLVVVSVSQKPLAESIVPPLLVMPASQVRFTAEALAAQKSAATASQRRTDEADFMLCHIRFPAKVRTAGCSMIVIGMVGWGHSVFIWRVGCLLVAERFKMSARVPRVSQKLTEPFRRWYTRKRVVLKIRPAGPKKSPVKMHLPCP